jgi:hypothetical protein
MCAQPSSFCGIGVFDHTDLVNDFVEYRILINICCGIELFHNFILVQGGLVVCCPPIDNESSAFVCG